MVSDAIAFFRDRFGITPTDVERLLGVALSRGGDYADLYFEYTSSGGVQLEESIVKSATRSVRQGVGVRVVAGEKTGYAYTDDIAVASIERAARTAAAIARSTGSTGPVRVETAGVAHDLYPVDRPAAESALDDKIDLLRRAPFVRVRVEHAHKRLDWVGRLAKALHDADDRPALGRVDRDLEPVGMAR